MARMQPGTRRERGGSARKQARKIVCLFCWPALQRDGSKKATILRCFFLAGRGAGARSLTRQLFYFFEVRIDLHPHFFAKAIGNPPGPRLRLRRLGELLGESERGALQRIRPRAFSVHLRRFWGKGLSLLALKEQESGRTVGCPSIKNRTKGPSSDKGYAVAMSCGVRHCRFTAVVYSGEDLKKRYATMKTKKAARSRTKAQIASWVRASISFPPDLYQTLADLAKEKKVSLAWVVREAAEKYVVNLHSEK